MNAAPCQNKMCVKNIHSFKEKYDEVMLNDGTKRAGLNSVKIQLGKNNYVNTHTYTQEAAAIRSYHRRTRAR